MADRSLVSARLGMNTDGTPFAAFECDCGLITVIRLTGITPETADQNVAYTCDNCETSHWFWIEVQINER